jgi:hypothetical protein
MNLEKHVTSDEVSMAVNLLPKYLEGKIKVSTSVVFCLNLPTVLVWSNMSDTIRYLLQTPHTRRNFWLVMSDLGKKVLENNLISMIAGDFNFS